MVFRFLLLGLALAAPNYAIAQPRPITAPAATAPRPAAQQAAPATVAMARTDFLREMDNGFLAMDADKDGFLTKKEIEDYQRISALSAARQSNQQLFAGLDADRNGSISATEFLALPMNVPQPNAAIILAFDANRDGKVSKVENRAATLANFDRIDADKDGVVTNAEKQAFGLK